MTKLPFYRQGQLVLTLLTIFLFAPIVSAADTEQASIDWLEIAYKKAEILSGHASPQDTIDLINQLTSLGHTKTARELLEQAPPLPEQFQTEQKKTLLQIEIAEYFQLPDKENAKSNKRENIHSLLLNFAKNPELTQDELLHFEKLAEQFDSGEAVITLAKRLAQTMTKDSAKWWYKAGQWSMGKADKGNAVLFFQEALDNATSEADRQEYQAAHLRALFGNKQTKEVEIEILAAVKTSTDRDALKQLALFSLQIERPDLAWQLYGRLYSLAPEKYKWLDELVRWSLAANQPLEAALFLQNIPEKSLTFKQKVLVLSNQFSLMRSGDNLAQAVHVADQIIEMTTTDKAFLEQAVQVALGAGAIDKADDWNTLLLEIEPDNSVLLQRQLDLAIAQTKTQEALQAAEALITQFPENKDLLATGISLALSLSQLDQALSWNNRLRAMDPSNEELLQQHADISMAQENPEQAVESVSKLFQQNQEDTEIQRQLAQLEEWTGNAEAALSHWQNLQQREPSLETSEQVFRLSKMLYDQQQALSALQSIESHRQLTEDEIKERISLYEVLGEPEEAVSKTSAYLQQAPDDYQIWLELAHLQMRSREYQRALETWEEIATRFGRNTEETLFRSECYWRIGKKRKALEVMESFEGKLTGLDNLYHANLLVELGWRYRRPDLARHSFDNLLEYYDKQQFFMLERIIYLQQEAGNREQAIAFAIRSAEETDDPRFLMLALNIAAASLDENQMDSLLEKMNASPDTFETVPLYWIIQAQRHYAMGDFAEAEALYQKAITLDIGSITAKEGVLWSLLSQDNKEQLTKQLSAWELQAINNKELWLVYALCRQHLGQYQQAGLWYEKLVTSGNTEYGILLGYADALEAVGAADRAYRLRINIMQQLRLDAASFVQQPAVPDEAIKTYATLIHRYGSTQQGEYWLEQVQQMEEGKVPNPWMYEFAISWYLNNKRHKEAQSWLAKAHEQRVKTPYWQELVLALEANDTEQLARILEREAPLDLEQKVAALEKLERQQEALRLAESGIDHKRSYAQRSSARRFAVSFKQDFPDYWSSGYDTIFSDLLDSQDAHLGGRFSLENTPISFGAMYRFINYSSSVYNLEGHDLANDLAFSTAVGDGNMGGSATLGLNSHEADDIGYGYLEFHKQLNKNILAQLELAIHAVPDVDSILQTATLQNRLDATIVGSVATHYYYYLDIWGRDYATREGNDVAIGYGATTEVGFKQNWGSYQWLVGVQGNFEHNFDRELPDDLRMMLPDDSTVDEVIAKEATSLLVGGRVGRGDIREEYPVTGSIRYFASAYFGQTWPQNSLATYLKAGLGSRVLGNDELSLQLHYNQSGDVVGRNDDSGISLYYRYHF